MSAVMPSHYEGEFNPTTDGVEIVPKIWVGTVVELGTKVMQRFLKFQNRITQTYTWLYLVLMSSPYFFQVACLWN